MEKSKIMDYAWKGFTVLLSIIIVPCFIWIWDSEMRLGALEYKMDDANKSLEKIEEILGQNGHTQVVIKILDKKNKLIFNLKNKRLVDRKNLNLLKNQGISANIL